MGKNAPGYTLMELLVVVGIIILISTVGLISYHDINHNQILNQQAKDLASAINLAQNNAFSQKKPAGNCTLQGYNFSLNASGKNYIVKAICGGFGEDDITTLTGSVSSLITINQNFNVSFLGLTKEVLINGDSDLVGIKIEISIDTKKAYLIICKGGMVKVVSQDPGESYCP